MVNQIKVLILAILSNIVILSNSACVAGLNGCSQCLTSTQCKTCVSGTFLNSTYLCQNCPTGCSTCTSSVNCLTCITTFSLTSNLCKCAQSFGVDFIINRCAKCLPSNCRFCYDDNRFCTRCYNPRGVNQNKTCSSCFDSKCVDCSWNSSQCYSCIQGYGVKNRVQCVPCFDSNCISCMSYVNCAVCRAGYGPTWTANYGNLCVPCSVANCLDCSTKSTICRVCNSSYNLTDSICENCTTIGCIQCNLDSTLCTKCMTGFGLLNNSCIKCFDPNCLLCSFNPSICLTCNYTQLIGLNNGSCVSCTDPKCIICVANSNICTYCANGYGVLNNICVQCNTRLSNCLICWTNASICNTCEDGYGLNISKCSPCQSNQCLKCPTNPIICGLCNTGYGVTPNGTCISCNIPNCLQCGLRYDVCTRCSRGYGLNNGTCISCIKTNCLQCYINASICEVCVSSRYALKNGSCLQCNDINCLQCSTNQNLCTSCIIGYGINGSACLLCSNNCLTCSASNYTQCLTCFEGFYLSNGSNCLSCPINCLTCTSYTICTSCRASNYLSFDNLCYFCPASCSSCYQNNSYIYCTSCANNSYILNNNICEDFCGDSLVLNLPCDNLANISYDGCNDQCNIMTNFTCITQNHKSICSYYETIGLNITSLIKQMNQFSLTLSVQVSLNIFTLLTAEECLKLFNFTEQQIQISQISYNQSISSFNIKGNINGTSTNSTFTLVYHPQGARPQFFASLIQNIIIKFPEEPLNETKVNNISFMNITANITDLNITLNQTSNIFFGQTNQTVNVTEPPQQANQTINLTDVTDPPQEANQTVNVTELSYQNVTNLSFALIIPENQDETLISQNKKQAISSNILEKLSYTIVAISWILSILGLIIKKSSTIDFMIAIQLSWVFCSKINNPNILNDREISPLALAGGFSIPFIQLNQRNRLLQQFNSLTLENKLGFNLIITLIITVIVLICYLRLYILKNGNKTKNECIIDQSSDMDKEIKGMKLMRWYENSLDLVIQFCLITLPFYCICIYDEISQRGIMSENNELRMALIIISLTIYAGILAKFVCNTTHFFRTVDSFDKSRLSQLYHIFYVLSIIVLLVLFYFAKVVWSPFIPCFVLICYTIGRRPFKKTKLNVVSVLNLLIVCNWVGFHIYRFYSNQSQSQVQLYLTITLFGVLPFGLIVNLVCISHETYLYFFGLSSQEMQDQQQRQKHRLQDKLIEFGILTKKTVKVNDIVSELESTHSSGSGLMDRIFGQKRGKVMNLYQQDGSKQKILKSKIKKERSRHIKFKLSQQSKKNQFQNEERLKHTNLQFEPKSGEIYTELNKSKHYQQQYQTNEQNEYSDITLSGVSLKIKQK